MSHTYGCIMLCNNAYFGDSFFSLLFLLQEDLLLFACLLMWFQFYLLCLLSVSFVCSPSLLLYNTLSHPHSLTFCAFASFFYPNHLSFRTVLNFLKSTRETGWEHTHTFTHTVIRCTPINNKYAFRWQVFLSLSLPLSIALYWITIKILFKMDFIMDTDRCVFYGFIHLHADRIRLPHPHAERTAHTGCYRQMLRERERES